MAARRATQLIALRHLARGTQQRQLHILAPAAPHAITSKQQYAARPSELEHHAHSRGFSQSAAQHTSRDASTIDFFYFPSIDHTADTTTDMIRVPLLPDNYDAPKTGAHAPEAEFVVHKPEINTMSMDSNFLPMAENHDGHAMGVDFHAMADKVAANVRDMKVPVEEQASMMKQLWNDMVDDLLGLKKKIAA